MARYPVPASPWGHVGAGGPFGIRGPRDPALLLLGVLPADGPLRTRGILPPQQPREGLALLHVPRLHREEGALPGDSERHAAVALLGERFSRP